MILILWEVTLISRNKLAVKHAMSVTITKDIARYKTMKEHSELDIIKFENVNPEQSSSSCTKRVSI